jgi:hypothetical protein
MQIITNKKHMLHVLNKTNHCLLWVNIKIVTSSYNYDIDFFEGHICL